MRTKLAAAIVVFAVLGAAYAGFAEDAFAKQLQIVTSRGNVFTVKVDIPTNSTHTVQIINNTQVINNTNPGITFPMEIVTKNAEGHIVYGNGTIGAEKPLDPYTFPDEFEFAAVVLDTDTKNSMPIPKLLAKYEMVNDDSLNWIEDTDTGDNILIPLDVDPNTYVNGWKVEGDWTVLDNTPGESRKTQASIDLPLNEQLTMKGEISSGMSVQIISVVQPYNPNTVSSYSERVSSSSSSMEKEYIRYDGPSLGSHGWHCYGYWPNELTEQVFWTNKGGHFRVYPIHIHNYDRNNGATSAGCPIEGARDPDGFIGNTATGFVTHAKVLTGAYGLTFSPNVYALGCQSSTHLSVTASYRQGTTTVSVPYTGTPTISCTSEGGYQKITRISIPSQSIRMDMESFSGRPFTKTLHVPLSASVRIDIPYIPPIIQVLHAFSGQDISHPFTMQSYSGNLYLRTVGGDATSAAQIKAFVGQEVPPAFIVTNMPENAPYRITADGIAIISGLTSNSGSIEITPADMDFDFFGDKDLELVIWPDSMSRRGGGDAVMFDAYNKETKDFRWHVPMIYVAESMLQVSIDQDGMDIAGVILEGGSDISFDDLQGLYNDGDELFVPLYPDANAIAIRVNGEWADEILADIQQFPHSVWMTDAENAATGFGFGDELGFTVARASDRIAAFANDTGDMQVRFVNARASGSAEFQVNVLSYSGSLVPPGAPDTKGCFVHDRCGAWANNGTHVDVASVDWDTMQGIADYRPSKLQQIVAAQGPLTAYVNAYVNGEWIKGQTIFESTDVTVVPGDYFDSHFIDSFNSILEYGAEDDDATMSVQVEAGDFVEFVVSARTVAASTPVYAGGGTSADVWWGNSTSRIHSGLMQVTMP